jgi:hypothetical protein
MSLESSRAPCGRPAMVTVFTGSSAHGAIGRPALEARPAREHASRRQADAERHEDIEVRRTPGTRAEDSGHRLAHVSVGAAIALGAVLGLAIGIVVSVATDVPLAPEAGLVLGALVGWFLRRNRP